MRRYARVTGVLVIALAVALLVGCATPAKTEVPVSGTLRVDERADHTTVHLAQGAELVVSTGR
jgi:uncharacterized lipoprotein